MGSAPALPHPLLTLPAPSLRSPRPLLAISSSSSASTPRLSVPRAPALGFSSAAALSPLIRRSRDSTASIARASAEDGQAAAAAGDADVAAEAEEESVESEAQEEGSSVPEGGDAEEKPPRKPRVKLGEIMGILNKRAIEAAQQVKEVPDIRTGDIVEIKLEVPENRRRLSVYKGIVISKQNAGIHTTIRIRRIIAGIGVEIVFPVYSPNIKEIKVVNHRKVRRARLYYLRDKLPRLSTFK
ncbi:50S ribosomal protein L19-1, chloroplastic [Ananas comosus]|uniref:50S ribosomal protein L19, chloroplastic n=1 Tax=Ananas comosus TaxID=4615 RepID=A0A199UK85_ANACO|nr:50S ribosomal protein L19-1, chloroplastic [Ananas comosus]OAY65144.1 50S ribosomal protein L19, chloroplastic [Ananas comosus]